VVSTSDLHGHIDQAALFGGFVNNLRAVRQHDGGVVLVDAGDMFQGTIAANETEGAAVIRAYNALGYHAAVVGNHEFDYGPVGPAAIPASPMDDRRGALIAAAQQARFPLLAANFLEKASGKPVQWPGIVPSTLVEVSGIKVGIVGVSGAETLETTIAANVDDLQMATLPDTIQEEARRLRAQGATVVIAAAHAGGACKAFEDPDDLSSCEASEIFEVANALDPALVNVLVGAHTHRAIAHRVNGIAVVQSYAYGKAFGRVDLHVDPSTNDVVVLQIHPPHPTCEKQDKEGPSACTPGSYEGAPVQPSEDVLRAVAEDIARSEAKRKELVGVTLTAPLASRGAPASPLATQVAAWMLEARPKAQVALVNAGGIRAPLPAGPLAYGAFYEMFPFDNRFATATVKVSALRKLVRDNLLGADGFAIAGVQVQATCKGPELQVDLIHKGRPLRDTQDITLLTSDYLAMTSRIADAGMPRDAFSLEGDPPIREALMEHLRKKGGTVSPIKGEPIRTPGQWPVVCPAP
jgi:5'-nucleotidase